MIEVCELTKRYGARVAVDHLSFAVKPGRVTGFLGPNGAGKSTTLRMILGLDRPDDGWATVAGRPYRQLAEPLRAVGALLEARAVHPGRTARNHLLMLARTQGMSARRVDEVIDLVGLGSAARRRAGGYSLGMSQRLGLAAALLGDPQVLILDEPLNGLDTEGIRWLRELLRSLAGEGCTVLVSSHLMNEMSVTAEHIVVIGRGRLIADCPTEELISRSAAASVSVRGPDMSALGDAMSAAGGKSTLAQDGAWRVTGLGAADIGELAARQGLVLHELHQQTASLEEAFMEMTRDSVDYDGRLASEPSAATTGASER